MRIKIVMNHNQNDGLLKMIRKTDPMIFEVANCDIKLGWNKKTPLCIYSKRNRNAERHKVPGTV